MESAQQNARSKYAVPAAVGAAALAVLLRQVLLLIFFGVLIGMVFNFPIRFLQKAMPRGAAVLLTLLLFFGLIGGIGCLGVKPMAEQARELKAKAPEALAKARSWMNMSGGENSQESRSSQGQGGAQGSEAVKAAAAKGGEALIGLGEALSGLVIVIVLAAFFSHEPKSYHDGLKTLLPKAWERDFEELWKRLAKGLEGWLGGILISMSIMGALTAAGLAAAGIKQWPLLGFLTFLGTFVPYVGAISSSVPGLILALTQSSGKLLATAGVYLGVHLVEGYVVQPLIMKRAVEIRPAVSLAWQLVIGTLCGIMGIIVATPLLVCVQISVDYLYIEKRLGKESSGTGT